MPSRRGEVYAAVYVAGLEVQAPFAATFDELMRVADSLRDKYDLVFAGPPDLLPSQFSTLSYIDAPLLSADALLSLSAEALASGRIADPLSLNPLYVVPPAVNQHKDPRTALRLSSIQAI
jgi:tRNA A37 threonylcarbamoyladenosine modification protein TsaB